MPIGTTVGLGVRIAAGARVWVPPGTASPDVDGDFLKGGSLDEDISTKKVGFLGAYESLHPG